MKKSPTQLNIQSPEEPIVWWGTLILLASLRISFLWGSCLIFWLSIEILAILIYLSTFFQLVSRVLMLFIVCCLFKVVANQIAAIKHHFFQTKSPAFFAKFFRYKPEQASEAVSDSHNYFMAFFLLVISLLCFCTINYLTAPDFHNTPSLRWQAEAKQYVDAMNRTQQAYFLERNAFSNSIKPLNFVIKPDTEIYIYSTRVADKAVFNYGVSQRKQTLTQFLRGDRASELRIYIGGVFLRKTAEGKTTTLAILCEADKPGTTKPAEPTYQNGVLTCGEGTRELRF